MRLGEPFDVHTRGGQLAMVERFHRRQDVTPDAIGREQREHVNVYPPAFPAP